MPFVGVLLVLRLLDSRLVAFELSCIHVILLAFQNDFASIISLHASCYALTGRSSQREASLSGVGFGLLLLPPATQICGKRVFRMR